MKPIEAGRPGELRLRALAANASVAARERYRQEPRHGLRVDGHRVIPVGFRPESRVAAVWTVDGVACALYEEVEVRDLPRFP